MNLGDEHNGRYALPCSGCGALTWQKLPTTMTIRCGGCLAHAHGIGGPVDRTPRGQALPRERKPRPEDVIEPPAITHTILIPARAPSATEIPNAARTLIALALEHERKPAATYSLAESRKDGTLVRTVVVRFTAVPCMIVPHATYTNGRFDRAWWARDDGTPYQVGNDAIRALVAGQPVETASVHPCRACGRPGVRMTMAGVPYAHTRLDSKEKCSA